MTAFKDWIVFFYILEIYDPYFDFIDDCEYDGNSYINPIIVRPCAILAMKVLLAWILRKDTYLIYSHKYFSEPKRAGIS